MMRVRLNFLPKIQKTIKRRKVMMPLASLLSLNKDDERDEFSRKKQVVCSSTPLSSSITVPTKADSLTTAPGKTEKEKRVVPKKSRHRRNKNVILAFSDGNITLVTEKGTTETWDFQDEELPGPMINVWHASDGTHLSSF
jgi:hypothetical protein